MFAETKIQEMSNRMVRSLGVGRCLELEAVNFKGAASGVLVFWDNKVLQLIKVEVGNFSISCQFKNYKDDFCWSFTEVHGPTLKEEMEGF